MRNIHRTIMFVAAALVIAGCSRDQSKSTNQTQEGNGDVEHTLTKYVEVPLTTNLAALTPNERLMLPLLIEACQEMDGVFWMQAYGDRDKLLAGITDPELRRFAEINYGPWDRLGGVGPIKLGLGLGAITQQQ